MIMKNVIDTSIYFKLRLICFLLLTDYVLLPDLLGNASLPCGLSLSDQATMTSRSCGAYMQIDKVKTDCFSQDKNSN